MLDREQAEAYLTNLLTGELESEKRRRLVREALMSLPEKYRAPILLVHLEDVQYREVASMLDETTDSVRKRLHRARNALQEELDQLLEV